MLAANTQVRRPENARLEGIVRKELEMNRRSLESLRLTVVILIIPL